MDNKYLDNCFLNLNDMDKITNALNNIVLRSTYKIYKARVRKMLVALFQNKNIRHINNHAEKYGPIIGDSKKADYLKIYYMYSYSSMYNVIRIPKKFIYDIIPNLNINISKIYINKHTIKCIYSNRYDKEYTVLNKYCQALDMLNFYFNPNFLLNAPAYLGWKNKAWCKYYKKSVGYLKNNNILFYKLLTDKNLKIHDINIDIYEYYRQFFSAYILKPDFCAFLSYIKMYNNRIKKGVIKDIFKEVL